MPPTATATHWVRKAFQEGWAIGQFNISTLEVLQAIVEAADETNAPVMVGTSNSSLKHLGLEYIAAAVRVAREHARVPIMLHLDHGPDLPTVAACIQAGFDSVMIDASTLPYDENVALVRHIIGLARPRGVSVEAQIGETWEEEGTGRNEERTTPEHAKRFVDDTGVDYLAVSIGNTPGVLDTNTGLDLPRLGDIAAAVPDMPLVLHGGSSILGDTLTGTLARGVAKINIDAAIRDVVTTAFAAFYQQHGSSDNDVRIPLRRARDAVKEVVRARIRMFGAENRAA